MDLEFALALWPVAALLLLLAAQKAWRRYTTLRVTRGGVSTVAEVVRSRLRRYDTMVEFGFEARGEPLVQKRYLEGVAADLKGGQRLVVKYLPEEPSHCVLVDFEGKHDAR